MLKSSMPEVCQVVASINKDTGGPAYSVTSLAESLQYHQIDSHLFTLDYKRLGSQVSSRGVNICSPTASTAAYYLRGFQPSAKQKLHDLAKDSISVIHNHGLWMFQNLYARQIAEYHNIPLIISPRGTLESWSLNNSRFKKQIAWLLYEKRNLSSALAFHATSYEELKSIRQMGFRQPIALIPNGVHLPDLAHLPKRDLLEKKFPELIDKSWLLFLSRIHPKKGLDNLLNVWKQLSIKHQDWHLVIAGPDLIGYQAELKRMTTKLNLTKRVTFTGMLSGEDKASAFANSDLFVLPTYSENFGIAIAEALSYKVPVVTTTGAPWQELEEHQCGWWIEPNLKDLERALDHAISLSDAERYMMGEKGRQLVENRYSWDSIGKRMAIVYRWILQSTSKPDFVYT